MRKQKFLSFLLALAMTLSILTPAAYAVEPESTEQSVQTAESSPQEEATEGNSTSDDAAPTTDSSSETAPANDSGDNSAEGSSEDEALSEDSAEDETDVGAETPAETDENGEEAALEDDTTGEETESATISPAADYDTFLSSLKVLESYASDYALANSCDAVALVLNYIRTGIEKYNTDSWATLAGAENTGFVSYVAEQDASKSTTAQAVRGIDTFAAPDGAMVEFAHMFATMDLTYYNSKATTTLDYGGWAGDIVDLMEYTNGKLSATEVEAMAGEILNDYFGIDDDENPAFGIMDFRGDMDAYYLITNLSGSKTISSLMESYFTSSLTDADRAAYFATNRFSDSKTQDALRKAVLAAYQENSGVSLLEADRSLTDLSDLRTACCYAFADYLWKLAGDEIGEGDAENPYYTVFSSENSTLAPGVEQNISYALTADDKQIVYYTATVDISRDDVQIYANYKDNDASTWGMARVTDQMAAAEANHSDPDGENYIENYTPVVGVNADFYNMTTGAPSGALVMEGVEYHGVGSENFFAILKDGTAMIGGSSDYATYKDQIQEAVGGSIYLVKDGEIAVSTSADYYNSRASRTCVGITADGKVVLMVLDGRQEPFSAGGSAEEIAQIMLEAGCVTAINLDGGGSTTYAAKEEGADEVTVVNSPSDGYERSVSSSLMVVSTAQPSNTFDHALVSSETDYLTVGASLNVTAIGVSISGGSAELPDGAELVVSDESVATLSDGVLTGVAKGDVTVSVVANGETYGSKTLHVVMPDGLTFTKDKINAVYGSSVALPLEATYNENPVTISADDITFTLSTSAAGVFDGLSFIGNESSGVRMVTVTAQLTKDLSISDTMEIALYKNGEAVFDFDTATSGDGQLAWNRDVTNSTTDDEVYYHITDTEQEMDISYIFALDMTEVPVPDKIKPLLSLVAGGDTDDVRAWDLLLQLAERVGELTTVTVNLQIDPNLDIDYSELTLVNDYFTLTSTSFDEETNTLTIVCNWIKQTQAIDEDTANPIVILSGIKAKPKADAAWDENECLAITNSGNLSYDIYLRSSTLYNVASQESTQETYGIYPYADDEHLYNGATQKGGHFSTTYKTFEDSFTLDKSSWNGWKVSGDDLYYYVDNKVVTGVQYIPGYEDENNTYYYSFDENGVCQGKITGLFELNGELYYAVNGEQKTGWRPAADSSGNTNYYYFDPITGAAVDGTQQIGGYTYTFENKILVHGDLVTDANGTKYMWAGVATTQSWKTVDEDKYYFRSSGYAATGVYAFNMDGVNAYYVFDESGVWQESVSGLYDVGEYTFYLENGIMVNYPGLVEVDGNYYYFAYYPDGDSSYFAAIKGRSYWVSKTNGLVAEGNYTFDEDGKMVNPPVVDPDEPDVKNGIVEENDSLYYYVDGVLNYAGLIEIDGGYYYVKSNCEVVHGRSYWITKTNGLMPEKSYTFADDGKMVDPAVIDSTKNGIVEENDSLYYYVDGVLTYAGLIEVDGSYYYVKTSGEVVHGCIYWITKTNGLMSERSYTFADNGKMVDPAVVDPEKDGIVEENDSLYYYEDGVLIYAGLIELDGSYYYVRTSGEVVHGRSYWITKTNGLMAEGSYTFADDGKMVIE